MAQASNGGKLPLICKKRKKLHDVARAAAAGDNADLVQGRKKKPCPQRRDKKNLVRRGLGRTFINLSPCTRSRPPLGCNHMMRFLGALPVFISPRCNEYSPYEVAHKWKPLWFDSEGMQNRGEQEFTERISGWRRRLCASFCLSRISLMATNVYKCNFKQSCLFFSRPISASDTRSYRIRQVKPFRCKTRTSYARFPGFTIQIQIIITLFE